MVAIYLFAQNRWVVLLPFYSYILTDVLFTPVVVVDEDDNREDYYLKVLCQPGQHGSSA